MTDTEKESFQWLTERLYQLAYASAAPATAPLAAALIPIVTAEASAAFPGVEATLKGMQAAAAQQLATKMATDGPALWKTLHTRALAPVAAAAPGAEMRWLYTEFPKGIPCGECKQFYFQFLQANKPDFADYFIWTVNLHNAVNRKLGKPEMSVEAARALWNKGG